MSNFWTWIIHFRGDLSFCSEISPTFQSPLMLDTDHKSKFVDFQTVFYSFKNAKIQIPSYLRAPLHLSLSEAACHLRSCLGTLPAHKRLRSLGLLWEKEEQSRQTALLPCETVQFAVNVCTKMYIALHAYASGVCWIVYSTCDIYRHICTFANVQ